MSRSTPPQTDELEISVIGPGKGECILIHIGGNEWCIVDSCRSRGSADAVAVEYLKAFGNDALKGVKLVVATHWHDDHIRGLASILKEAPSAKFACSMAMQKPEFMSLVAASQLNLQGKLGVQEFATILDLIRSKATTPREKLLHAPKWAKEGLPLLEVNQAGRFAVQIRALSPSDGSIALALAQIAELLPRPGTPQLRIPATSPNHTSVALWVKAGPIGALLGADLEHTGLQGEGWIAVLDYHEQQGGKPTAVAFKVPHHGSVNADCPEVWERMLVDNPIAVVTPYTSGTGLPKSSDLRRLASRTSNLFCTIEGAGKAPKRDRMVEKYLKLQAGNRRVLQGLPGHVRIRWLPNAVGAGPRIELFNGARHVKAA